MVRSVALFAVMMLAAPALAVAQANPPGGEPTVITGFDNGFFVQTGDGDFRLAFGLTTQLDGRFSLDEPSPITDTFTIRKMRPAFSGRIARYFEFRVVPDFGNGVAVLQDAFVDTRFSAGNAFHLRVGKDKTPVGYEMLLSDANLFFPERSLVSTLLPSRDVGIQAQGELAGNVTYAGGIFNGVADGVSSTEDVDANSGKDVAGRILWQPWRSTAAPGRALSGLGFHLGGSAGDQSGSPLPAFDTSVGQIYFAYAGGVTASGRRTRVTPAAFYFYRPFGVFTEYALVTQDLARDGVTHAIANHAMDVTAGLWLTGESAGTGTTRPRKPFDPAARQWGAAQVVARFSHLEMDGDVFVDDLAAPGASRRADQWTIGFNWFPTAFTKWYVDYERTTFDENEPGARPIEHVILFRAQLAF